MTSSPYDHNENMATAESVNRVSRWSSNDDANNMSSLDAAREAAAKVNTMLIAKGKLKPSQLSQQHGNKQMKVGAVNNLVVAEVEINDVPIGCRNMLTRGSTQEEISKFSGAAVSTRGRYLSPEDRMRNLGERALYLCVQGPTQETVDMAVGRINEIIANGMKQKGTRFSPAIRPPPVSISIQRPNIHQPPPLMSLSTQPTGLAFVQDKLYIGLEHAPPNFDVKGKIYGPGGSFLQHIQTETGAKVTLRGKGSGFLEPTSGREAFEPMHIHIQHPTMMGLQQAKQLSENLIQTVQQDYAQFQQALVALPPTVNPGTATLLAGLQQSAPAGALISQQPGMASLTTAQPGLATIQNPQGLQTITTYTGLVNPVVTSVVLPTSSSLSTLPPTSIFSPPGSAPGLFVPSSLGGTSFSQVPVVTSVMADSLLSAGTQVTGAQPPPQQVLVQTHGPPPQIQTLAPLGAPPPQIEPPGTLQAPAQSLVTTIQPEIHLVSQPVNMPMWGAPALQSPLPPSSVFGQMPDRSSPGMTLISSSPVTVTSSPSSCYSYTYPPPREEPKRRFTEEKQEDKVPDNLLGYEHGPPHLTNLVVQGPPPPGAIPQQQYGIAPPQVSEAPPSIGHAHMVHALPVASMAPNNVGVTSAAVISEEQRNLGTSGQNQNAGGLSPVHSSSPHPPQQTGQESPDSDKKLMPPPPLPGMKRASTDRNSNLDRKKPKGALGGVTAYGSDEDDEELNSTMKQHQKEAKKYQFNQYSNAPQIYGQPQASQPSAFVVSNDGQVIQSQPPPQAPPQPGLEPQILASQVLQPPPPQQGLPPQQALLPPTEPQFQQGQYPPLPGSPTQQQQQQHALVQQQIHLQAPAGPFSSQPPPTSAQFQPPQFTPSQSPPHPYTPQGPSPNSAQFVTNSQVTLGGPPPIQRLGTEQILAPPPGAPGQRLPAPEDIQPPPGLGQRIAQEQLQPPPPNFAPNIPPGPPPPPNQAQFNVPSQPPQLLPPHTPPPPQFSPGQQFSSQQPMQMPPPPPPPGTMQPGPPVGVQFWMPS